MAQKDRVEIDIEALSRQFNVRPEDGRLISKIDAIRRKAGQPVGSKTYQGYWQVKFGRRNLQAHRVVWALTYGKWPDGEIDHINGDKADNRIWNLRDVSASLNMQNRRCKNKTGLQGVVARGCAWDSQILVDGKRIHLGRFNTQEAAHIAYLTAKRKFHPGCTF